MYGKDKCLKALFGPVFAATVLTLSASAFGASSATEPVSREKPRWVEKQEAINSRVKQGNVDLLWIGDSIVENWGNQGKAAWDKYYAHRNAANLGIGGDRTEHVLWRLDHGNIDGVSPKLAIVMIGQNNGSCNSAWEITEGVTAIVAKLRDKLPEMKILLLGIFYRGENPNAEQSRLAIVNDSLSELADNKHIFYMNINKTFLNPDGTIPSSLMPDFEHPNEAGHWLWAKTIEPKVAELFGDSPVQP
jgi:beta-glucosidase